MGSAHHGARLGQTKFRAWFVIPRIQCHKHSGMSQKTEMFKISKNVGLSKLRCGFGPG